MMAWGPRGKSSFPLSALEGLFARLFAIVLILKDLRRGKSRSTLYVGRYPEPRYGLNEDGTWGLL